MTIKIANAQGFWGDHPDAPRETLEKAVDLDYLTLDYLAELTMVILSRQEAGYAADFVPLMDEVLSLAMDNNVTIITNSGGLNPSGCRDAVQSIANDLGKNVTIGIVTGDDFRDRIENFQGELEHAYTGDPLPNDADVVTANTYFGAFPVAEAIERGADVVITGRVTDTALVMGPMIHEFDWKQEDYNRLANGMVAGHIIECGSQATGGNFHANWQDIDFESIGYPIAEVNPDGETVITKPADTGGIVSVETVAEQLLYEVGDPSEFYGPDVIADFKSVSLEESGDNRVSLTGITGSPPTNRYKASLHYTDGWRVRASVSYSRPDVKKRAERAVMYLKNELRDSGICPQKFEVEYFGANAFHDGHAIPNAEEIEVRVGVEFETRQSAETFSKLVTPLGLGGPPGVVIQSGRPKPRRTYRYHPVLLPKEEFTPLVEVETK